MSPKLRSCAPCRDRTRRHIGSVRDPHEHRRAQLGDKAATYLSADQPRCGVGLERAKSQISPETQICSAKVGAAGDAGATNERGRAISWGASARRSMRHCFTGSSIRPPSTPVRAGYRSGVARGAQHGLPNTVALAHSSLSAVHTAGRLPLHPHYGFLANGGRSDKIARCRQLLAIRNALADQQAGEDLLVKCEIPACSHCDGTMRRIDVVPRACARDHPFRCDTS